MKAWLRTLCLAASVLSGAVPGSANAQSSPRPAPPGQTAAAACPAASDTRVQQLYGLWQADIDGQPGSAALRLERHPEWGDSVRGTVTRNDSPALLAGDIEGADFTLEESVNGENISATWIGRVVEGSCAQEIRGIWTDAANPQEHSFILRKQPGWH